jgi:hypothetical protein
MGRYVRSDRVRNDQMSDLVSTMHVRQGRAAFGSGWLIPQAAWAVYSQNGVVRQIIQRIATLMLSKPWTYERSDVKYDWGPLQSELESLGTSRALRSSVIWMMIFGGSGIVVDVDDGFQPWSSPLDLTRVRKINRLIPKTAMSLRPEGGTNWATANYFEDRLADPGKRVIHKSRVIQIVAHDVPPDLGVLGAQVYSSQTGWPPSWIEGIYTALCEWKDADRNVGTIIRTMSLLFLQLDGFRVAMTSPDSTEANELEATLEQIAANLDNNGMLTIDKNDNLGEVSRNTSGLDKLIEQKKLSFVAATGVPKELVLMEAEGNLGQNSAPIDAYNSFVDGLRTDTLTDPLTTLTDIQLAVEQRESTDPDAEFPSSYTLRFAPLSEQSGKEIAEQRDREASARERDFATGVPAEVIASDPSLDVYPDMSTYRTSLAEAAEKAAEVTESEGDIEPGPTVPASALESAAKVAERLGVRPSTVIALIKSGKIKGHKINSRWRLHWPSVWEALNGEDVEQIEEEVEGEAAQDRLDSGLGLSESTSFGTVTGASDAMREIFAVLERVAGEQMPVLITGESGTGKEGIARGLHGDRSGEFVALNCAALPDSAAGILAELSRMLERAAGGTLFLDEVGELSADGQASLLRALADTGDVRIVSATWRELEAPAFRLDLLMRLAQIRVEVPPLRERGEDVLELAAMFYGRYAAEKGWPVIESPFTPAAVVVMGMHPWPGNVRELKNAVERGALFAGAGAFVEPEHLGLG